MGFRDLVPIGLALCLGCGWGLAEPLLREDFEQQGRWRQTVQGDGSIELSPGGVAGRCLKLTSRNQAYVYYSLDLDPGQVCGKRLTVRAQVKTENVVKGEQEYATAKLHFGVTVDGKVQNFAQRFVGTAGWHEELLTAQIPATAQKVVLDLGIQNATGIAWYDNLEVEDSTPQHEPLDLGMVTNSGYRDETADDGQGTFLDAGTLDLRDLPAGDVRLGGVDFHVTRPQEGFGRTCLVLRGAKRPQFPDRPEAVVPVGRTAGRLFFLGAAAWAEVASQRPCLVCTVLYADGQATEVALKEGVDLGAFETPQPCPNWRVVWQRTGDGPRVGLGVATWPNPRPGVAIRSLRFSTPGTGGVPILVAVSLDPRLN